MVGSRRFRVLVGIFIPFLIFFLMSQNISNANAINYEGSSSWSSAEWVYYPGGTTQTSNMFSNYYLKNITFINRYNNSPASAQRLYLTLRNNINLSKSKKFRFNVIYKVYTEFNTQNLSIFPSCPRGYSGYVIDKCELSNADQNSIIKYLGNYDVVVGNNITAKPVLGDLVVYYIMHIEGHYNSNNDYNTNQILTTGPYFTMFTTDTSGLDYTVYLDMGFSQLEVYSEDDAEQEVAEKELEGTTNIENQTPQNTTGGTSENQQTTSIIGTISSFVGAFSNISPSQNCEIDLPFPDFVGGNQRVNICQGKDKAPALITAASSLLLIVTFVPVAFIILSMIYIEIRSFTNG